MELLSLFQDLISTWWKLDPTSFQIVEKVLAISGAAAGASMLWAGFREGRRALTSPSKETLGSFVIGVAMGAVFIWGAYSLWFGALRETAASNIPVDPEEIAARAWAHSHPDSLYFIMIWGGGPAGVLFVMAGLGQLIAASNREAGSSFVTALFALAMGALCLGVAYMFFADRYGGGFAGMPPGYVLDIAKGNQ